ncbi:hypothetical protein BN8_03927 [Fibrisoma limi BUZ 3]|uniref:Uncharacterized protein n=1 Tax=Fibrisoma limi BUZ 3 TaxID=1185876 RepID=I2GLF1_9BACT|nr:hypothetical protein BN8_03927 [Fibrisoma limi BUZ 3]
MFNDSKLLQPTFFSISKPAETAKAAYEAAFVKQHVADTFRLTLRSLCTYV